MKTNLFNKHRMDKFANDKDFKLNLSKHELLKEHIAKLERRELKAGKRNYLYFYDNILKGILGYQESNIDFESPVKIGGKSSEFALNTYLKSMVR